MNNIVLGVDTSNYTTSLSLIKDGEILCQERKLLPVQSGKCGLRQSDAVFLHTKALPEIAEKLFSSSGYSPDTLCAVGVSAVPRDSEDSYMPCFLAGVSFASGIAHSHRIPLYSFSHQAGHISAAVYSSGTHNLYNSSHISFHVSGGTTDVVLVHPSENSFVCDRIGGSNDAHAGQIIDRIGTKLGLDFPCGASLDVLSQNCSLVFKQKPFINGTECSLSGLENICTKLIDDGQSAEYVASFMFNYIGKALYLLAVSATEIYPGLPMVFAGGVLANTTIRHILSDLPNVHFATRELSSDNACGTGLLAYRQHFKKG